ncbi:MAG: hypothetical protein LBR64_10115 [Dysgonamonadaceae bacterium]|jgi:hypothetical protein|nr:hypothetical protein [Dysgonamonadaceae bacterium]
MEQQRVSVVIAGVKLDFRLNHKADIESILQIFRYHSGKYIEGLDYADAHEIVIQAVEKLPLPEGLPLVWNGFTNIITPLSWYNPVGADENFILIGNEVLIRHIPAKNLTYCYLVETKGLYFRKNRPIFSNYSFFLLHSILAMYGKFCIHAACVSRDGKALLLPARSGEGKTTLCMMLGKAGYEFMGDDLVFISQNAEKEIIIDSLLCYAKLHDNKSRVKKEIDFIDKFGFNFSYRNKLAAVVKIQKTAVSERSYLLEASRQEAFIWLLEAGNNCKILYRVQEWMDICEKTAYLPHYTLLFGNKGHFDPELLNSLDL